jgi:hypothetical protein
MRRQSASAAALFAAFVVGGAGSVAQAAISNLAPGVTASDTFRYRTPSTGGPNTPDIAQNNDTLQTLGAAVTINPSTGYLVGNGNDWRDAGTPVGVGGRADLILAANDTPAPPVDFIFNNTLLPGQSRRLDSLNVIIVDTTDDRRKYNFDILYSTEAAPTTFTMLFTANDNVVPSPFGTHITSTYTGINNVKTIRLVSRLPFNANAGQNAYYNEIDINLTTVPEPAGFALLAGSLFATALTRGRRPRR